MILDQNTLSDYLSYSNNSSANFLTSMPGMGLGLFTENFWGIRSKFHFMRENAFLERGQAAINRKYGADSPYHTKLLRERQTSFYKKALNKYRSTGHGNPRNPTGGIGIQGFSAPARKNTVHRYPIHSPASLMGAGASVEQRAFESQTRSRAHDMSSRYIETNPVRSETLKVSQEAGRNSRIAKTMSNVRSNIRATEARWNRMGYLMGAGYAAATVFELTRQMTQPSLKNDGLATFDGQVPTLLDNNRTYTGRQRSLMAIHNSQLHARAALGNEAMYLS